MVLVDTSVWIRFLTNAARFAPELDRLLEDNDVVGHELVYGELLIGDRGGRSKLLAEYAKMHQAPLVPHSEVVAFAQSRELSGRGLGWIDVHLLAATVVGSFRLWSADESLTSIARELGVQHGAPSSAASST
jgi:predicted nucleic acid-binding protein